MSGMPSDELALLRVVQRLGQDREDVVDALVAERPAIARDGLDQPRPELADRRVPDLGDGDGAEEGAEVEIVDHPLGASLGGLVAAADHPFAPV